MDIDVRETQDGQVPRRAMGWGRLVSVLPALAFLATFGYFLLDKNREARTVLGSGRGLLVVAVIVIGYAVVALALRRFVGWAWAPPVLLAGVVLGLAAWTIRPYYVDETASRSLVSGQVRNASDLGEPPVTEAPAPPPTGSDEPAADEPVSPSTTAAPTTTTPPPAPSPVRISTGAISGIDHDASGAASLIRRPDGSLIVRFESFDIEGTPDPQVYLADGEDVRRPDGVHLGRLPGNQGETLDFDIPAGTEAGPGWTVLVWCGRFSVPIANAGQSAA